MGPQVAKLIPEALDHQFLITLMQLTDFCIGKKLGVGTFGSVYHVRDKRTGFISALKIVPNSEYHEKEIEIHKQLNHPNIIQFYNSFSDDTRIFLSIEYAGSNLFEKLQTLPGMRFEETQALNYVHSVMKALDYLHSKQIIYCDLKPENLVFGLDGEIKLIDFGISLKRDSDRRCGPYGALDYCAPEMLVDVIFDIEVDIWSTGILFYEMSVGGPPFEVSFDPYTEYTQPINLNNQAIRMIERRRKANCGIEMMETIRRIIAVEYNYPNYISQNTRRIIDKLLVREPSQRISFKELLKECD